jgi:hypothetical protein
VTSVTVPRRFALHSAVIAITLKIRLETPQGRQPLARAIVTNHLQSVNGDLALP